MPKILISYRRADSAAIVGRIYDRLVAWYGPGSVFLDIDGIPYATDFRDHVRATLKDSNVVLAVVGPLWRGATGASARIMDDDDPVRVEIETALETGVPVFPLLVNGAKMPGRHELPASIERFAFLNAATIDSGRDFHPHVNRLIASLDEMLGLPSRHRASSAATAAVRSPYTWALAVLVLGTAAGFAALAPPWPPGAGGIGGGAGALALIGIDLWLVRRRVTVANRVLAVSALSLALALGAYLTATSVYVYQAPNNDRFAKGTVCTPEAHLVYKEKCPNLGLDELRGAEYDADRLWTTQSIAIVQAELNGLWVVVFVTLAGLAASLRRKILERDPAALGVR